MAGVPTKRTARKNKESGICCAASSLNSSSFDGSAEGSKASFKVLGKTKAKDGALVVWRFCVTKCRTNKARTVEPVTTPGHTLAAIAIAGLQPC